MGFLRRRLPRAAGAASSAAREERAYLLLEEARLLCERLHACGDQDAEYLISPLHRQLGLAGYFASSSIRAVRRHALLDRARSRARAADHLQRPPDIVRALVGVSRIACDAVGDALGVEVLSDHMHLAHVHLLSAQELLRAAHSEELLRGSPSPRVSALTGDTGDTGDDRGAMAQSGEKRSSADAS
jgi:hypothetical protein